MLFPNLCPYLLSLPAAVNANCSNQPWEESVTELRGHSSIQSIIRKGWQSCWKETVRVVQNVLFWMNCTLFHIWKEQWVNSGTKIKWRSRRRKQMKKFWKSFKAEAIPLPLSSPPLPGLWQRKETANKCKWKRLPFSLKELAESWEKAGGDKFFHWKYCQILPGRPSLFQQPLLCRWMKSQGGLKVGFLPANTWEKSFVVSKLPDACLGCMSPHRGRTGWRSNVLKAEKWFFSRHNFLANSLLLVIY